MTPERLEEIRAIESAATAGPWQWYGNTKMHEVYLATLDRGRVYVMDFQRWGMTGAQPRFQCRLDGRPGTGIMRRLGDLGVEESPLGPQFEVPYRRQFGGIGHPDATFIAKSRQIVHELLAEVDRLRNLVGEAVGELHDTGGSFAASAADDIERRAGGSL